MAYTHPNWGVFATKMSRIQTLCEKRKKFGWKMKKTIIFFLLILLTTAIYADLNKGLVAYYPFDGNANDESENWNNGKVHGATLTTDRFGNEKSSYYFDGKNDYIEIYSSGEIVSQNNITFSAWIFPQKTFDNERQYTIFAQNDKQGGRVTHHIRISEKKYPSKLIYDNWEPKGAVNISKSSLLKNTWYHITIVRYLDNVKLYINGVLDYKGKAESRNDSGAIDNSLIGARDYKRKLKHLFWGKLDDIYIYNRALSESEIKEIYNKALHPKQTFPPDLYIENLKFFEPSINKALDGLEKGSIQFDIVNKGRGNAYDLEINITPLTSSQNLSFKTKTEVEEVLKKDRKKISIPISADINVKDLFREFRIEITASNGFNTDPATISFETLAFSSPNLKIEQIAIDDNEDAEDEGFSYGNGNSIIEPNESIEVTAYLQNFGEGTATDVKAKVILTTDNRDITYPDEGKILNLGDIESGDYKNIKFYFYTSRRYDEDNIPLSILLTENTGEFGKTVDLGLKLGDRTKNVVDVQVSKIKRKKETRMKELDNIIVRSDVDENIPKTNIDGKNTLAIIIGIEDYKYAPSVDFASNDARVFYQYSKSVFGIPEKNIYYRINDGATSGEFNKIFAEDGWIARRLKKEQTDVIVYYSGHGAPDTKSEKGYLIPHDIDPNYASTGVSLDFIYSSLSKLQAKSVTLFIDACFSGESRSEEMLVAGIRPISVKIKNPILTTENMAVFSASTGEQYSSAYPEKQHGLFTYFLLKGLKGEAKGSDKEITLDELQNYLHKNVGETAGYLDKEQNPTFIGKNKTRVLIKY